MPRRRHRARAHAPRCLGGHDPVALARLALDSARARGFAACGVADGGRPESWDRFRGWLDAGFHGEMGWLNRDAAPRRDPGTVLPGCRSILVAALPVGDGAPGNLARYARGEDYHLRMKRLLGEVVAELRRAAPKGARFRVCVDTAPLLERELAVRAGLGFLGKNGLLIVPGVGSHVVLGEVLTDLTLASTPRMPSLDHCGACTRCLDECPTAAIPAPGIVDARRCLSYLTIEKRGPFTSGEEGAVARSGMLFGCDVCQDVCPWNAPFLDAPAAAADPASLELEPLLDEDPARFEERFGASAVWRATPAGLARNARALLRR